MKVLLDIKDGKADFMMELLKYFPFVKVKILTNESAQLVKDLKDAVDEMNLIKAGHKKGQSARDFLKEL